MKKRLLASLLTASLLVATFAGCASEPSGGSSTDTPAATETPAATDDGGSDDGGSAAPSGGGPGSITYPLTGVGEDTIRYWKPVSGDLIRKEGVSEDNGTAWAEALQEQTGLTINFINPAVGQENEQFNLLLASNDRPDIIEKPWLKDYPAGPDDAVNKKLAYDFTDVAEEWAPDFLDYIRNHGDLDKRFKSDEGRYWSMGFIRENDFLTVWRGPIVRTDLLQELGIDSPETMDEWTEMLRAFKDHGVEYPFSAACGTAAGIDDMLREGLFSAWGAMPGFYMENGTVIYGPTQEGFHETLKTLRSWYAEGLMDPNFATNTSAELNAIMGGGRAGATIGNTGGGIGAWTPVLKENDPNGVLEATVYPTVNKGETARFGQKEGNFYQEYITAVINPNSSMLEACVKLLNYGYTEEGNILMNYGVEGVSFDWVDGYPKMKDEIALADDNKAEWSYHARAPYNGVMVQRQEYLEQLLVLDVQKEAVNIWSKTNMDDYQLPPITATSDEGGEYSRIYSAIEDYYKEFTVKYIVGEAPEDAWETEFVPTIQSMDIERATELRQVALDRYNAR